MDSEERSAIREAAKQVSLIKEMITAVDKQSKEIDVNFEERETEVRSAFKTLKTCLDQREDQLILQVCII